MKVELLLEHLTPLISGAPDFIFPHQPHSAVQWVKCINLSLSGTRVPISAEATLLLMVVPRYSLQTWHETRSAFLFQA